MNCYYSWNYFVILILIEIERERKRLCLGSFFLFNWESYDVVIGIWKFIFGVGVVIFGYCIDGSNYIDIIGSKFKIDGSK